MWSPENAGTALCDFWRGVENLNVNRDVLWAVSQAAPMRRMVINGDLALSEKGGYSSGGFLGDVKIKGTVNSGTQQQWMSRNS